MEPVGAQGPESAINNQLTETCEGTGTRMLSRIWTTTDDNKAALPPNWKAMKVALS